MANIIITNNAKFNPFSYQEMLAPALMATQAHQELENQYGELESKASIWDKMANEQTDSNAYKMYKTYADDLKSKADQLAMSGLNATSRRELLNMRSRYGKEITPIENAYKARAEEIKEQTAGKANGIVYEGDAATSSLNRYLENPSIKYNMANSREGFQRVATAAAALQKKLRGYGRGKALDGFTRTWLQEHGYRDNEVYQAISDIQGALQGDGNIRGNNILNSILANEMNTSGVSMWKNKSAQMDYFNRIAPALYQAVGQSSVAAYEDKAALLAAQEAMQIRAENRAAAREKREKAEEDDKYRANPIPLRSQQEITKDGNEITKFINKGFLRRTKNGLELTRRGLSELNASSFKPLVQSWENYKKSHPNASRQSYNSMVAETNKFGGRPNNFSTWYNKNIGGYNSVTKKVSTPTTRLNRYENSLNSNTYDVYRTTEYDIQLKEQDGKNYMTQMWSSADIEDGEQVLKGVEFLGKDKGWSKVRSFTKEDLAGYRVTNVRPSLYGNTVIVQSDKEGKNDIIRIEVPAGMNPTAESNLHSAVQNTGYFSETLRKGLQPVLDKSGSLYVDQNDNLVYSNAPLTDADKIEFRNKRDRALRDIYRFSSQIVVPAE